MAEEEQTASDAIPRQWKRWFKEDKEHSAEWRKDAREDYDFVAGKQWSDADKQKLRDEMRPAITFNRIGVIVDAVSGQEVQNKQQVHYYPREQGDAVVNELYSEAARWFDDQSDADDEDSDAFMDTVTCGMGWTETRMEFDEDPDGEPLTERIDPLEMFWDANCSKNNLKGAKRLWRVREMSRDEAMEMFPDRSLMDIDAGSWVKFGSEGGPHQNDPENFYDDDEYDGGRKDKKIQVVQLQYWEYEPYHRVADPMTGQVAELSGEELSNLKANMKRLLGVEPPLQSVELRRKKYKQAFIGNKVLEHEDLACDHFTLNCITGKRDRNAGTWYGLVRTMKDPQTWANKWLSQLLHIMNSNAKGGVFYESGAFTDQADAERQYAKANAMIEVNSGALTSGRIQERQPAQFPQGYQLLTEYAVSAIRDVTGVNLELLGMREANQAGVLEYQRRQAGLTVLSTMFKSLQRYRRARGKVLLYYIQEFLSDGRLIRITGKDSAQYVPLTKQADAKYDIIIDDAPTAPNQKEIVWQNLTQLLPGIKDIVPPQVLLQLLDYSPLPTSVVQKIKEVVQAPNPQAEQAAKAQAQAMLLDLQQKQADVEKTKSETAENIAETQTARAKLGLESQKQAAEVQNKQMDNARQGQQLRLDKQKHLLDVANSMHQMANPPETSKPA